jgi:hypothetical protein
MGNYVELRQELRSTKPSTYNVGMSINYSVKQGQADVECRYISAAASIYYLVRRIPSEARTRWPLAAITAAT